jgi:hypothetical protein
MLVPSTLLDRIGPVLSEASAGTAKAGLDLVGAAGARSPGEASRAALVAAEAMRHPSVDVQRAAIALVSRLAAAPDAELAAAVAERQRDVAASQRSGAAAKAFHFKFQAAVALESRSVVAEQPPKADHRPLTPTDPSRGVAPIGRSRSSSMSPCR